MLRVRVGELLADRVVHFAKKTITIEFENAFLLVNLVGVVQFRRARGT